jgi:hypothetical protein
MEDVLQIELTVETGASIFFYSLLQKGFFLNAETGTSLHEFLLKECGVEESYINDRIKTVFIDNQPVDDFKKAILRDGSILSLSGPMPGLVGATMRAGGFYSSFRSSITYSDSGQSGESGRGMVYVKLFNIVMTDLGKKFLGSGIICKRDELVGFFSGMKEEFWKEVSGIEIEGEAVEADKLIKDSFGSSSILARLRLSFT